MNMTKEEFENLVCAIAEKNEGGDPEVFLDLFMSRPERLSVLVSLMEGRKIDLQRIEITIFRADPMETRILVAIGYDDEEIYPFIWTRDIQKFCGAFFAGYEKTFEMYLRSDPTEMKNLRS